MLAAMLEFLVGPIIKAAIEYEKEAKLANRMKEEFKA
jgi:hypothetical protein